MRFTFAVILLMASAIAQSAQVTQCGTDVCFVYDDATLFGTGTVIDNNIFFLPTEFSAESLNGEGAVTANETLNVQVYSVTSGYEMTNFALVEQGVYVLNGANSTVDVQGMFAVTSNTTLDPSTALPPLFPDGVSPYRTENLFSGGVLDTQGTLTQWDIGTAISLADTAGWGSDTDVTVTIENLLTATTLENGEQAFIEKKIGAVGIIVNPIPIPAAAWLFMSGLGLLGWVKRRQLKATD